MNAPALLRIEAPSCKHCGSPTSLKNEYCCNGCQIAYELITSAGLEAYYKNAQGNILAPAVPSSFLSEDFAKTTQQLQDKCLIELQLSGISCSACAWLIEHTPLMLNGIENVQYDRSNSSARVIFNSHTNLLAVLNLFNKLGFNPQPVSPSSANEQMKRENKAQLIRIAIAFACWIGSMHIGLSLIAGMLTSMDLQTQRGMGLMSLLISLPSVLFSARAFYSGTYLSIRSKKLTLDTLVTIAIVVGFFAGVYNLIKGNNEYYFDAVTMLIAFLLSARFAVRSLELSLLEKQNKRIQKLFPDGADIKVGQSLVVEASEVFPCDGVVTHGNSYMNSAWLTGESLPSTIVPGSQVLLGSVNLGDRVTIQAAATGKNTRAGKILQLLRETTKPSMVVLSEKAQTWLVGGVLFLFIALIFININSPVISWNQLVSILIISCPCAFGVAIPMAFSTALKQGLENGILIKGSEVLERIAEVNAVILDKTGTVTTSEPVLVNEHWFEESLKEINESKIDLSFILASMAHRFQHPTLSAIKKAYLNVPTNTNLNYQQFHGLGIKAWDNKNNYFLGSRVFTKANLQFTDCPKDSEVFFAVNNVIVAQFIIHSQILKEAKDTISSIKSKRDVYLLSGDNDVTVKSVAKELGIPESNALSHQHPEMKLNFVKQKSLSAKVMMVGDGINDALALKYSYVGVGVSGAAHIALEAADVYLAESSIDAIKSLFEASQKIKKTVYYNFAWAIIFNALGLAFVLLGYLGPIVCAVLMPLSSVAVLSFSCLQRYFPKATNKGLT